MHATDEAHSKKTDANHESNSISCSESVNWHLQLSQLTVNFLTQPSVSWTTGDKVDHQSPTVLGAELRLSLLSAHLTNNGLLSARGQLLSSTSRAQLKVATVSMTLLHTASAVGDGGACCIYHRGNTRWKRIPLLSPTKLHCLVETVRWHGSPSAKSAYACRFVDFEASHLFLRFSPQNVQILCSLWRSISSAFRQLERPRRAQGQSSSLVGAPFDSDVLPPKRESDEDVGAMIELSQQVMIKDSPGGRAGVQQVAHSQAGSSAAWLTWRYAVPHSIRRLAIDTRRTVRSARLVPRALWGAHCELRSWNVVDESWDVWAVGSLRRTDDGWRLEMSEPQHHASAWEWQVHQRSTMHSPPPHMRSQNQCDRPLHHVAA